MWGVGGACCLWPPCLIISPHRLIACLSDRLHTLPSPQVAHHRGGLCQRTHIPQRGVGGGGGHVLPVRYSLTRPTRVHACSFHSPRNMPMAVRGLHCHQCVCVWGGSVRGRSVHSRDDGVSSAGVSPPHVIRGGGLGLRARSLHKRIMINTCIAICNGFTDIILIVGSSHSN